MAISFRWALPLAVAAVFSLAVPAGGQAPVRKGGSSQDLVDSVERLKKLRQDLETKRKRAEDLGGQEKNLLVEIRGLEESLGLTRQIVTSLSQREGDLRKELARTEAALEEAKGRLRLRKAELAKTVEQMYKRGSYRSLEILFSSRSFPNLLERMRFLRAVAGRNRQVLHQVEEEQARIVEARNTLAQQSRELDALKSDKQHEQARIEADVRGRTHILEGIRTEKSKYDQMVSDLEKAARDLEALIARMEAEAARRGAQPAGEFESVKGKLARPVEGEVAVTFGKHRHPKFGTVTFSNGVTYRAPLGTPVMAVAPGKVEHVSWLTGYGQCVILGHGDGYYTLYAHLSEVLIRVGQGVGAGERIASVGETGSLIGPCLHFEIRRGREALNPVEWIKPR